MQHAQQFGLQVEIDFGDFVEQNRSAVGSFESARAIGIGAGERTALVAEEFAFGELSGESRAVRLTSGPAARRL